MALTQIQVKSLGFVHYQHPDLENTLKFFIDFGLVEEDRQTTRAFLRGNGTQPYVYLAEQSPDENRHFIGAYWNVCTAKDLEMATTLPDATAIEDVDGPGGGKVVRIKDPHGFVVGFLYGQTLRLSKDDPLVLELATGGANFNTATEKLRNGPTRRFKHGPSPIYKLGHYGIGVPRAKYKETMNWYRSVLNLKPTDAIFDPKTDDEITCFNHIDLGEEFTDHHAFFIGSSATSTVAYPHHCSFEVNDFDTQVLGHDWLRSKGWTNCWGIGRHVLGSQIFDYWFDASGNVVEHYSDGDLVNKDTPFQREPAGPNSLYIWGPNLPLAFLSGKLEDVGIVAKAPPDVHKIQV
ncbi:Glyoxalase/Bleomycin resistance protein/Dihydroxybiphenyl dioxygenase [Hyaloscypha variabilis F]|uniref:Glyoxalase/Bleomycin resistance protein/Dihydroxybiphenyl dioxygenase n=1 Tax=Hyaloscypha variabilis (strain UAMH 11265 / GT02V1 / F) TaxID=1149755 RepID=A0A2J6QRT8_HYAVF|nr:Glyoxalase/Bleomycin resistance protein/Dihydroxybiphenyl dioxygenase [Hyaloscypha variabilis F]